MGIAAVDAYEPIETRIGVHDGNQFELKLDYAIDPRARKSRYQIEAYFFLPQSLGIDAHSYPREQFYADVQAYIRFKTPSVSLRALTDARDARSPLNRIPALLDGLRRHEPGNISRHPLSHELRLLGCLVKANVRDTVAELRRRLQAVAGHVTQRRVIVGDVATAIDRLCAQLDALLESLRARRADFMNERPAWVRELFAHVDEYVSIVVEAHLTALVSTIDADPGLHEAFEQQRARVIARIRTEQDHRQAAGYAGSRPGIAGLSAHTYRRSVLKKLMSSVLFLDFERHPRGRRLAHVLAGIAAAVAMAFSTIAAIWSQQVYGLNSFPFVIAVVIAYVFKDRIKEGLRTSMSHKMTRWLPDYTLTIRDPVNDIVVGRCRESFGFAQTERIAPEVLQCRHADANGVLEPQTKREVVMRYVKHISLRGRDIADVHGRLHDINDIIRFNVASFLVRMDDPIRRVPTYDREADAVRPVECPKRYHINVVLVLRAAQSAVSVERFRVILDKSGIQDLQQVELPAAHKILAPAPARPVDIAAQTP